MQPAGSSAPSRLSTTPPACRLVRDDARPAYPAAEYDPDPSTEYAGVFATEGNIVLEDDEAGYIEFDGTAGALPARGVIEIAGSVSATAYAKVWFRCGDGSAHATVVDSAGSVTVDGSIGTLTTGTSADTASNRIYIKNRRGASLSLHVTVTSLNPGLEAGAFTRV